MEAKKDTEQVKEKKDWKIGLKRGRRQLYTLIYTSYRIWKGVQGPEVRPKDGQTQTESAGQTENCYGTQWIGNKVSHMDGILSSAVASALDLTNIRSNLEVKKNK